MAKPLIVGFGGTTRPGSSGERMVAAVLAATEQLGAETRLFGGAALAAMPHFAPENPGRTVEQIEFVEAVRAADGIVIGSPGYHGGVSG
ncbi:MAG: NAD(P)H-dependent oxidoreductase, partial [Niveispirillum sp.]|nr:NAD(P)H-dependent oxidoreductase [Niveispirillum sp.]